MGAPVAAFCNVDGGSFDEDCILAIVVNYDAESGMYEVEDVESAPELANGSPRHDVRKDALRFMVHRDKVKRLPGGEREALRLTENIIPKHQVLALFPGTTCLYPATVINVPAKRKKTNDFLVRFKDDDVPSRAVSPRYIITLS